MTQTYSQRPSNTSENAAASCNQQPCLSFLLACKRCYNAHTQILLQCSPPCMKPSSCAASIFPVSSQMLSVQYNRRQFAFSATSLVYRLSLVIASTRVHAKAAETHVDHCALTVPGHMNA